MDQKKKKRTSFRNFREFIHTLFEVARDVKIKDWSYGQLDGSTDYFVKVWFIDNRKFTFYSKHMLWLSDITDVISKIEKYKYAK